MAKSAHMDPQPRQGSDSFRGPDRVPGQPSASPRVRQQAPVARRGGYRRGGRGLDRALSKPLARKVAFGPGTLNPETVLTTGLIICVLVIAAESFTGTNKQGNADAPLWGHNLFVREMSVAFVFVVLAIVAMLGEPGAKTAVGLSFLVTLAVVLKASPLLKFLSGTFTSKNADTAPKAAPSPKTPATAPAASPPTPKPKANPLTPTSPGGSGSTGTLAGSAQQAGTGSGTGGSLVPGAQQAGSGTSGTLAGGLQK